jgi:hypothetical protein
VRNKRTKEFKKLFARLPMQVQQDAKDTYVLFRNNPYHRSLQFKRIDPQDPVYSVRIGKNYRAVGWYEEGIICWFWIGSHEGYNHI